MCHEGRKAGEGAVDVVEFVLLCTGLAVSTFGSVRLAVAQPRGGDFGVIAMADCAFPNYALTRVLPKGARFV